MTRLELVARVLKLTHKVEALEEAGGGGVEFKTLDVTVTFTGQNHMYSGAISSAIPDNTVINEIIKIERVDVQGSGQYAVTQYYPLPFIAGNVGADNNVVLTGYEFYAKLPGMSDYFPLELGFSKLDTKSNASEITLNYKITYV